MSDTKPKWLVTLAKEIETGRSQYKDLKVKPFVDKLKEYADDIGCDGKESTGGHKVPSHVYFHLTDPETGDEQVLELYDIEIDTLLGCGCWNGITLKLVTTGEVF